MNKKVHKGRRCMVNVSGNSHTFDAQMVSVNFLRLPPAPSAPPLCRNLSLPLSLSSLTPHILLFSHHLVCHSADFSHSVSSRAPQLAALNLINEACATLASCTGNTTAG